MAGVRAATVLLTLILCAWYAGAPPAAQAGAVAEIRDVRGTLPLPEIPPFALTAGTVTGAAAAAGYLVLRRKKREAPVPWVPSPGGETPLQALQRCAARYRAGELAPRALCLDLDPLIRSTLASRSGIAPSALTTAELLQRLRGESLLPPDEIALASGLLGLCDRVKFAGAEPGPTEAGRFLAGVTRLASGEQEGAHEIP